MRVLHVVGARPNFMKAAPVMAALGEVGGVEQVLVHTGQHYDANMSQVFFEQLGLPRPDLDLEVGSASHAAQTGRIMMRLEPVVLEQTPDLVLVYGDVNSTLAAALVCAKLGVPVGHVEAGLRSFDRSMPEEINRLVTDQLAELLFTPSEDGDRNLAREGVDPARVHRVGNVMIDTLVRLLPRARERWPALVQELPVARQVLEERRFVLVTLHRPSNVDRRESLGAILAALGRIARQAPVVFPVHPRTRARLGEWGLGAPKGVHLLEPLGYLEFLALQERAGVVITDSGGVQEETTYLGVPCLTLRPNTERPVTVSLGTNTIVGDDLELLQREAARALAGQGKQGRVPPLWDGQAARRIAHIVTQAQLWPPATAVATSGGSSQS